MLGIHKEKIIKITPNFLRRLHYRINIHLFKFRERRKNVRNQRFLYLRCNAELSCHLFFFYCYFLDMLCIFFYVNHHFVERFCKNSDIIISFCINFYWFYIYFIMFFIDKMADNFCNFFNRS